MNKQQLAQKIWASANQMRSKIEANEYKDYILGFIFYKYLSDKEIKFLKENDYDDELLKTVSEEDDETVKWVQENIGYFIAYKDLFFTWLSMGKDFDVSNVRDALSAFSRLISNTHKKVFDKVFDTLQKDDQIHRFATIFGLDEDKLRNMMGLNLNEATINEFGRFDELKKSVDKTKAKAFFEAYEQTKLIPPKVNMKTDQLLRQFILTGGFEVDMP